MKIKNKIENIINQANNIKDYQEACFYIDDELRKIYKSWNFIELIKDKINKEYNTKLLY